MLTASFDYSLPENLIAKFPVSPRDHARLLSVDKKSGAQRHFHFYEIKNLLRRGDCLVLNNTKVISARLFGERKGKKFEVFLLKPRKNSVLEWQCLVRPGKKVRNGLEIHFPKQVSATIRRSATEDFEIEFSGVSKSQFPDWLEETGTTPLPPYLKRKANKDDRNDYQTVFAKIPGSVAAPTAGLHLTPSLTKEIIQNGVVLVEITLEIGYGTFAPIRVKNLDHYAIHEEAYSIPEKAFQTLENAKKGQGRIVALGTTSLRALESIPSYGLQGTTDLFIQPGYDFKWADGLITNFHLPRSSLYVLVSAFLGLEKTRSAYEEAIRHEYRFYSYGDAMAILE